MAVTCLRTLKAVTGGAAKRRQRSRNRCGGCAELPIPIVILRHPLHLARERSDATLRLRRGLRRTTSDKQRNGKWRRYHKARLWRIEPDRPIRNSRIVSDSPVAVWLPPIGRILSLCHKEVVTKNARESRVLGAAFPVRGQSGVSQGSEYSLPRRLHHLWTCADKMAGQPAAGK